MKEYQHQKSQASSSHSTMESLALPQELYWDGKSEPTSPQCNELFPIVTDDLVETENWLYDDNLANEILLDLELKQADELMYELGENDELVIELCDLKEENWPPEAVELVQHQIPTYPELNNIIATSQPDTYTKIDSTPHYDNAFNGNALEAGSLTTLTPPQSPPRNDILSVLQQQQLQQQQQHEIVPVQHHTIHYRPAPSVSAVQAQIQCQNAAYTIPNLPTELHPINVNEAQFSNSAANVAIKNEYEQAQLVDQIIEELAKDLPDMCDEYESHYTNSPPPSQIEESTTDEEWTPSNSANSSPSRYSSSSSSSSCSGDERYQSAEVQKSSSSSTTTTKKRRPYGRGVEDRKIRKKEQNKNAATRYRQKKKLEMELVLSEEQKLAQRNEELKCKLSKCIREMKYLKSLIREFYSKEYQKAA